MRCLPRLTLLSSASASSCGAIVFFHREFPRTRRSPNQKMRRMPRWRRSNLPGVSIQPGMREQDQGRTGDGATSDPAGSKGSKALRMILSTSRIRYGTGK
jgi:hypothetical protein